MVNLEKNQEPWRFAFTPYQRCLSQVLLSLGADRLTTTRVAERAGVSVGTLYQYYLNKQSLLFALFEDHLAKVCEVVEAACEDARRKPMSEMIRYVVETFVDARRYFRGPLQSRAGYRRTHLGKTDGRTVAEGHRDDAVDSARRGGAAGQVRLT